MAKAIWNGEVIAESDQTIVVESNHYFHPNSVKANFLRESDHQTVCGWKGTASYYDVVVNGKINKQAAWCYRQPKDAAGEIRDHIAFWKGVEVQS